MVQACLVLDLDEIPRKDNLHNSLERQFIIDARNNTNENTNILQHLSFFRQKCT